MQRAEWRLLAMLLHKRAQMARTSGNGELLDALAGVALDMSEQLPKPSDDEVCDECGAVYVGHQRQHLQSCSQF